MEWTDAEAAAEARLGNKHAFRVLVERQTAPMFRLAFLMSGNEQDAEDLVQETFLRAYKHFHTFDGSKAAVGTWLNRICVNCSLNLIRARKNRKEQATESLDSTPDETAFNWLDQIAAPAPSPERLTQSGQIAAMLGPALNMLTEAERTAFVLRHYDGSPIEEIARTLGLQNGAAKQTVFRAVAEAAHGTGARVGRSAAVNHLNDEQLTELYYGESGGSEHLNVCEECRGRFADLRGVLEAFHQIPIPQREASHGAEMWTRVLAKLPPDKPKTRWFRWWSLTPALAALLAIAFFVGRMTQTSIPPAGISETARERVLLMSLSDHLERSQIVLANVANAEPGSSALTGERDRAHELLGANRLLRQTAVRLGDATDAALLEELERALLDVANSADLEHTQRRIEQDGLLFRVRVSSVASRDRGLKL